MGGRTAGVAWPAEFVVHEEEVDEIGGALSIDCGWYGCSLGAVFRVVLIGLFASLSAVPVKHAIVDAF